MNARHTIIIFIFFLMLNMVVYAVNSMSFEGEETVLLSSTIPIIKCTGALTEDTVAITNYYYSCDFNFSSSVFSIDDGASCSLHAYDGITNESFINATKTLREMNELPIDPNISVYNTVFQVPIKFSVDGSHSILFDYDCTFFDSWEPPTMAKTFQSVSYYAYIQLSDQRRYNEYQRQNSKDSLYIAKLSSFVSILGLIIAGISLYSSIKNKTRTVEINKFNDKLELKENNSKN